jgi:hypothetical protein
MWGLNADQWNDWMVIALILAAIAAAAVVVTTRVALMLGRQETALANANLDAYKSLTAGKVADAKREGIAAGEAAADANAKVAAAQVEIKQQETITAQANARAAEAQLQAEKLRQQLAWRELTTQQVSQLVAAASAETAFQIRVTWPQSDPEAQALAQQIAESFHAAGWPVDFGATSFSAEIPSGISISPRGWQVNPQPPRFPPPDNAQTIAASKLTGIFSSANLKPDIRPIPFYMMSFGASNLPDTTPIIVVGMKPRSSP